jgi:hypothetical protein
MEGQYAAGDVRAGGALHLESDSFGGGGEGKSRSWLWAALAVVILLVILYYMWPALTAQGMQGAARDTRDWNPESRAFGVPIVDDALKPVVHDGQLLTQVFDPRGMDFAPWLKNLQPTVPPSSVGAREVVHAGK